MTSSLQNQLSNSILVCGDKYQSWAKNSKCMMLDLELNSHEAIPRDPVK